MKKQILLVDDNICILKLVYQILSREYDLVVKDNGLSALFWLEQGNRPALIISDLEMPNLDGETFIKNLKVSGFYRDIPIIVLSGLDNLPKVLREMNVLIDFIHKPFSPNSLKLSIVSKLKTDRIPI